MDTKFRQKFIELWDRFFDEAPLPIVFFYSDTTRDAERVRAHVEHRCVVADIARVRAGRSVFFDNDSVSCPGGKRYFGFSEGLMPDFEYFLSCGIPGKLEGERYKKDPGLVGEYLKRVPAFGAPSRYIIFKRWDNIAPEDNPEVVIFFANADVISGIFTLANFDEPELNGVFSPFGAGCATIVLYPCIEKLSDRPRCVLGMFDTSARPCVSSETFTIAAPMNKFVKMVENMEESFLTTGSWGKIRKRISRKA